MRLEARQKCITILKGWAQAIPIIGQAYIFGSRIKCTNSPSSDLDIAVSLIFEDRDTSLAYWIAHQEEWQSSLAVKFEWAVDLHLLDFTPGAIVTTGVADASILVYDRSGV